MRNKIKYSDIEKKHIIDKLSNVAKSRYYSLSDTDKKKFLKKAERFADKEGADDETYLRFEEFATRGKVLHSAVEHARCHTRKRFQSKNT